MDLSVREGRREQGLRIQHAVEQAGLSIEEIATRIGCSRALIYQYLAGSTLAQPDRLQRIAQECGVPLETFYAEESPNASDNPSTPEALPVAASPDLSALLSDLAQAQESPPDFRAHAGTCERLVALAVQSGEREEIAASQRRLGLARYYLADYPRASESMQRAIAIAVEIGDRKLENSCRQTLGGSLLAMGRLSDAKAQFQRLAASDSPSDRWKGEVSLGSIHEMLGEYRFAMERFDAASLAIEAGETSGEIGAEGAVYARLYVDSNRRYVYMDGGDFDEARKLAENAAAVAETLNAADQRLEARFDLAWCDFHSGKWSEAYFGWRDAMQLARFVGDQNRETLCRAWLGIFFAASGDTESALTYGKDALSAALSRGDRRAELFAQWALSDAYLSTKDREAEARYHINQALAITVSLKQSRDEIECRLRLARLAALTGNSEELLDAASRALSLAQSIGARHLEALAGAWLGFAGEAAPAASALEIAQAIGYAEAVWRSAASVSHSTDVAPNKLSAYEESIAQIESLRGELRKADLSDSLLELPDVFEVYSGYADLLTVTNDLGARSILIERTGWLPLELRYSETGH